MTSFAASLLNPAILFFTLGLLAVALHSDLEIPQPIPRLLAIYLLMAIGFRGGVELARTGVDVQAFATLCASMAMAAVVPVVAFMWLRRRVDVADAAALAAAYGSVSAVTFVTAVGFLQAAGIPFGGHMVAALALMESPAIVVGVLLANRFGAAAPDGPRGFGGLLRDACFNGSVLMIVGSLAIGLATGERGERALKPFVSDLFQGALCLFLLDMGLLAGRRLPAVRKIGRWLIGFGVLVPLVNAAIALVIASALGMTPGNGFLFCVLCASASYIAVPAAMRLALPRANPGIYVTSAIAITFPFNLLVGLPLYYALAIRLLH